MTTLRRSLAVLAVVVGFATPVFAAQEANPAGRIKTVTGAAFIVRNNAVIPAQAGQVVYEADALRTGPDGKIGVTLKDDTRLALGPGSEVRLERFAYAPGTASLGMVLKFVRGVTAYVSGRLAKLAPDSVRLETPSAIVGVRGTTLAIRVEG
ncbi:MAG TPA: FecR domain-containing protein [Vicinamibacterales bacterium]|nr:FecR domain-containing protein [Vicinamibacterales bacterium]